ncbi:MAG: BatA domain-containing protein [Kiritimatiellia bacterium]
MIPFGFSSLSMAWLALLALPLAVFYFLKLRRPRLEVPSLVLWRQALNDQRVNSPFQRFKRNLLLFVQLLALLFIVLAAMQPFRKKGDTRQARTPILVDTSASMGARAEAGGPTRFDEAKSRLNRRIDALGAGEEMAVLRFGATASMPASFTDNKRLLRTAVDSLRVEDSPGRPEDALRLAQALHRRGPFARAVLLTDGNLPPETDFELPFAVEYERIPPGGANLGVTAFRARRASTTDWSVFVEVGASTEGDSGGRLEILRDGIVVETQPVSASVKTPHRVTFRLDGTTPGRLEARLTPSAFDSLSCDNAAWLELPTLRPLRVNVEDGQKLFQRAMAATPGLDFAATNAPPDAAVTTVGATHARAELFIGRVPEGLEDLLRIEEEGTSVVDWERNHPLLQHVNLDALVLNQRGVWATNTAARAAAELGWRVLVHGEAGPLMLARESSAQATYAMLFAPEKSTLPYRLGFPILCANLLRIAEQRGGLQEIRARRTGPVEWPVLPAGGAAEWVGPDGASIQLEPAQGGVLPGARAVRTGEHRLMRGGAEIWRGGISLLSPDESSLNSAEKLAFREIQVEAATEAAASSDRPLWPMLALAALLLLCLEWMLYQHRTGGVS